MNAARKAAAMLPIGRLPALTPVAPVDPEAHVDSVQVELGGEFSDLRYMPRDTSLADAAHAADVPAHVAVNGGRLVYRDVHPDGSQHAMYVYDGTPPPNSAG